MKLSVIVLSYNVRYFLELCLKSVRAATSNIESEIIVVDNHSTDDSCQMVKTLFPEVVLIENKENYGFSKGNNIGVAKANGEYLCILNPDTVVAEDTFEKMFQFAADKEKLGIVGCKFINGGGQFLPESKLNIPYVRVALKKMCGNPNEYHANHLNPDDVGTVDVLVGAFMFLKRQVFQEVKGFDEDYFMYGEDVDFSYKTLKAGYNNYYYGQTTIIHFKGESALNDKHYARRFYGGIQIFYQKHLKSNMVFDFVIWAGIKTFYLFSRKQKPKPKNIGHYVFISDKENSALQTALKKPIQLQQNTPVTEENVEVILDANTLSYKSIIAFLENNGTQNKPITYKILPPSANFILGSDSGFVRGEVVKF